LFAWSILFDNVKFSLFYIFYICFIDDYSLDWSKYL
jgi:hypothetical protein